MATVWVEEVKKLRLVLPSNLRLFRHLARMSSVCLKIKSERSNDLENSLLFFAAANASSQPFSFSFLVHQLGASE
jgi:hypothetical protein